ncbi:hypothetical protein GCM10017559_75500 [Streptosporangium longisporum]|uniref:Uncharacterized protein n=1 Tax=Streptosporangium longisporum TaxID=46187 RepID=A0ABP6L9F0_9ACTN
MTEGLDEASASEDDRKRVEAVHALWRITGDERDVVRVLTRVVEPLAEGRALPVMRTATRYLAEIGPPAVAAIPILRAALALDRRLTDHGGWRAFDEDRRQYDLARDALRGPAGHAAENRRAGRDLSYRRLAGAPPVPGFTAQVGGSTGDGPARVPDRPAPRPETPHGVTNPCTAASRRRSTRGQARLEAVVVAVHVCGVLKIGGDGEPLPLLLRALPALGEPVRVSVAPASRTQLPELAVERAGAHGRRDLRGRRHMAVTGTYGRRDDRGL